MTSKYQRHRLKDPNLFVKGSFRTVPLSHTTYKGKKSSHSVRDAPKGAKGKAIVARLKKTGKWTIQSILEEKNGHKKRGL